MGVHNPVGGLKNLSTATRIVAQVRELVLVSSEK
jgi:hypothetical protein